MLLFSFVVGFAKFIVTTFKTLFLALFYVARYTYNYVVYFCSLIIFLLFVVYLLFMRFINTKNKDSGTFLLLFKKATLSIIHRKSNFYLHKIQAV